MTAFSSAFNKSFTHPTPVVVAGRSFVQSVPPPQRRVRTFSKGGLVPACEVARLKTIENSEHDFVPPEGYIAVQTSVTIK